MSINGAVSKRRPVRPMVVHQIRAAKSQARQSLGLAVGFALLTISVGAYSAFNASYTYDALGRLTEVGYTDGSKTSTIIYSYDAAGNRTRVVSTSPQ
jgi:hypothetical protein